MFYFGQNFVFFLSQYLHRMEDQIPSPIMQEKLTVLYSVCTVCPHMVVKNYFKQDSFIACTSIRGSSLLAESIRRHQLADRKRSPGRKSFFDNKMDGQVAEQYGGEILQVNT
jgi:hypothetical protein